MSFKDGEHGVRTTTDTANGLQDALDRVDREIRLWDTTPGSHQDPFASDLRSLVEAARLVADGRTILWCAFHEARAVCEMECLLSDAVGMGHLRCDIVSRLLIDSPGDTNGVLKHHHDCDEFGCITPPGGTDA